MCGYLKINKKYLSFDYKTREENRCDQRGAGIKKFINYVGDLPEGATDKILLPPKLPLAAVSFRLKKASLPEHNSSASSFPQYNLSFTVKETEVLGVAEWLAGDIHGFKGGISEDLRRQVSKQVMNTLNRYFTEAAGEGCFTSPFFAVVAYRLTDGSHAFAGSPVLMIPSSLQPLMRINSWTVSENELVTNVSIINRPCRLQINVGNFDGDNLALKDVERVEILVSRQATLYDSGGECGGIRNYQPGGISHTDKEEKLLQSRCRGWDIPGYPEERIAASTVRQNDFYMAASFTLDEILSQRTKGGFVDIATGAFSLHEIYASTPVRADYSAIREMKGDAYRFNNRVYVCSPELTLPAPFPAALSQPYTESVSGEMISCGISCSVRKKRKDTSQESILSAVSGGDYLTTDLNSISKESVFPRFLFYPDCEAVEMKIELEGETYRLPMTRSDNLDGSYYFRGFGDNIPEPEDVTATEGEMKWREHNALFISDGSTGHVFPAPNVIHFDSEVMGTALSMRAMSTGQLGEFPLYCFTRGGIWLLRQSVTGVCSAVQMISRDAIDSSNRLVSTETGCAYVSSRGLFLMEGSVKKEIFRFRRLPTTIEMRYDPKRRMLIAGVSEKRAVGYLFKRGVLIEYVVDEDRKGLKEITTLPVSLGRPEASKKLRSVEVMFTGDKGECQLFLSGGDSSDTVNSICAVVGSQAGGIRCTSYRFWSLRVCWDGRGYPSGMIVGYLI